jgi:glycosyltransferase involved in cell wall biosynthesis
VNRRVLFIGYFYPDANMGGVRMRRLARLLPGFGWDPVVLTHAEGSNATSKNVDGIRVETVAAPDLTRTYRQLRQWRLGPEQAMVEPAAQPLSNSIGLTSEINRWLMIPDKQIPWRRPAVKRGRELLAKESFSAIFASQEPRTSLLVAARLSRQTGIPCVLEYRDLWTGNPYYHITQPTVLHRWIHRRLERQALRQASRVSAVSRGIAEYLTKVHHDVLPAPVDLNYNFFDPAEYAVESTLPRQSAPFTISYAGAFYGKRKPHEFFEGMQAFLKQSGLTPAQFRFRWAGGASGIGDLEAIVERTGARPYLDFLGQIPHRNALRLLMESHASLLIQAPDDAIHIPGKLFEAMGARVPVLALAHPCEVTEIIERCRAGIVCPYTKESVANALTRLYQSYSSGHRWNFEEAEVGQFSSDHAVRKLAALLESASV